MTPLVVRGVASESPSGHGHLDNLPSEVLSEVASYLDFMDIVAVQQVNDYLLLFVAGKKLMIFL